jgi:ornithine cyclodeaminase/alanine dehydrogenase-like protein (mu-crystallin family)
MKNCAILIALIMIIGRPADSGRTNPSQITLHRHHTGLGLWYTAAGQKLYEAAVAAKAGKELPDEIFYQIFIT